MKKDYKEIADELAYIVYKLYEGDEVEGLERLREYGYVDDDHEWIYEEDE